MLDSSKKELEIKNKGYMIQLDSLRALAVLSVALLHFTPDVPNSFASSLRPIYQLFHGVPLFFVLSGFLITGILLRCRDIIRSNNQSVGFTLRRFYIRRFLRIFPIYYLTLFVTALIFKQVRSVFFWHLTYTTNIMVFLRDSWDTTSSHFWTLSMEEQFYIIWPCIILLTPKKHLLKAILATVLLAVVSRFGCYFIGLSEVQMYAFPLNSLDSLGLGALLAFFTHNQDKFKRAKRNLCNFGLWICFPVLIFSFFQHIVLFDLTIRPITLAFFYVWLVGRAAEGFGGLPGRLLELKPIVFIGKISYGIYIYHLFVFSLFMKLFGYLGLTDKLTVSVEILLKIGVTVALATLSWFWFEKPINDLKNRFGYERVNSAQT
jgi:peptidoglycan/LPS O-acetylase OafA/YrhL